MDLITKMEVLKNGDLRIKTAEEGVFNLSPQKIENVTEKDKIVKAEYGNEIYTITPDMVKIEIERDYGEGNIDLEVQSQFEYSDEDYYEMIKQWFLQHQRKLAREEIGRIAVKTGLPPGMSQKLGKFLGGKKKKTRKHKKILRKRTRKI